MEIPRSSKKPLFYTQLCKARVYKHYNTVMILKVGETQDLIDQRTRSELI